MTTKLKSYPMSISADTEGRDRMDRYDPYTDSFLRDTQYGILGTNLAEVGTDAISRQSAIEVIEAGCPKWKRDNPSMDCENCEFLKEYKKEVTT